jgi:putative flavoprotein involved in K+ transport
VGGRGGELSGVAGSSLDREGVRDVVAPSDGNEGYRDVVIVGAGPAGLALARELRRRGVDPVLLERDRIGSTWAHAYDHLRLHTRREAAALPGLRFPPGTSTFPRAAEMHAYLCAYAERFALDVHEGVAVTAVARDGAGGRAAPGGPAAPGGRASPGWLLTTSAGPWRCRVLVWAGGIWSAPRVPSLPGRERFAGEELHVRDYRGPEPFRDRRLLVVGAGNSGKDVAVAAVGVAASVTVAVRGGVVTVPYPNLLSQRSGSLWRRLPPRVADAGLRRLRRPFPELGLPWPDRPMTEAVPVVGFELVEAVRAGRVEVRPTAVGFTEEGVRFADGGEAAFDVVVLATGFRPATGPIAAHLDGTGAPAEPNLLVVGARYPTLETWLQQLRREAPAAARQVVAALA